ncbi:N-acyl-D-amino-acid deacylase family protein [Sphingomonas sp. C3-2]|uniref:N-acyl-D-amino-acid deacylase family protein n=1 Tax=Sphingomonas sp. C3-2 TaxID=3062169 RepID=UPI00294AD81F|nr:amidohydrolase family protein [Sphingomonas sp. C3-2]WOK35354.1 amidohydrolase family protein [Sphingomonas sp. C3-2]
MAEYDLVIRGGHVVDGKGESPFAADIAVKNGRIARIGAIEGTGAEEIDATGLLVTPGFVDAHTHYDGQAIWSDRLNPSSAHGVTTAVLGNCGVGFAPCRAEDRDTLINVMEGVEDIPGVVMADGLSWDWETFPQYLDALDRRTLDIDVAAYLPHSPLRVYAMGERGAARDPASEDDLSKMRALAREAVEAGALGFATSRQFIHRTRDGAQIPSFDASEAELEAIAAGLRDADKGIMQLVLDVPHLDWETEVKSLVRLVQASGRPATFTLGTANEGTPDWNLALKHVEKANAEGAQITAQVFPRPIGLIIGHNLSVNPFGLCPSYAAIEKLPLEEKIAELRKPETRATLLAEDPTDGHPLAVIGRSWDWMFKLGSPPNYAPSPDQSVAAQAARAGVTPTELVYDWLLEDDGNAMLYVAIGNYYDGKLDMVADLLNHPDTIVGLGDGGAHYGVICDASYPTFLLTYWTRDHQGRKITIPQAIKMLAADPAKALGLQDRGVIAVGYKADFNLLDEARLALHAPYVTHDLPAGGRRLDQKADGYVATIVSGTVIARNGQPTGKLPGRLVRGQQPAPTIAA